MAAAMTLQNYSTKVKKAPFKGLSVRELSSKSGYNTPDCAFLSSRKLGIWQGRANEKGEHHCSMLPEKADVQARSFFSLMTFPEQAVSAPSGSVLHAGAEHRTPTLRPCVDSRIRRISPTTFASHHVTSVRTMTSSAHADADCWSALYQHANLPCRPPYLQLLQVVEKPKSA
jgi:hypothetical protein